MPRRQQKYYLHGGNNMKQTIQRIKSGEYDGADLMRLWCHTENLTNDNAKQEELIKSLYKGLSSYYDYSSALEDAIFTCGDITEEAIYSQMPQEEAEFNHKDCRFLLSEVECYLGTVKDICYTKKEK